MGQAESVSSWLGMARSSAFVVYKRLLERVPGSEASALSLDQIGPKFTFKPTLHGEHVTTAPTVTVITRTTGRRPEALARAIDSVRAQTVFELIEHVVISDGAELFLQTLPMNEHQHVRVVAISKSGRSSAGNRGLREARGSLVLFLDDDDWLLPTCIEALMQTLNAHPKASAAYSAFARVRVDRQHQLSGLRVARAEPFSRDRLLAGNFLAIQTVLFRRSRFLECGGFDESLDAFEDWELWLRYSTGASFVSVDEVLSVVTEPASVVDEIRARRFMAERWHLASNALSRAALRSSTSETSVEHGR